MTRRNSVSDLVMTRPEHELQGRKGVRRSKRNDDTLAPTNMKQYINAD